LRQDGEKGKPGRPPDAAAPGRGPRLHTAGFVHDSAGNQDRRQEVQVLHVHLRLRPAPAAARAAASPRPPAADGTRAPPAATATATGAGARSGVPLQPAAGVRVLPIRGAAVLPAGGGDVPARQGVVQVRRAPAARAFASAPRRHRRPSAVVVVTAHASCLMLLARYCFV
jgi:hypothetical protein